VNQPPEGSPTFAIAHEYHFMAKAGRGDVAHIDLYRVESEDELDQAGIPAYFWERKLIAITEWLSRFPEFEARVAQGGPTWKVELGFSEDAERRAVTVSRVSRLP
jgi:tRNA threonylcarbamoyladenosine biosynthesis protein TsaE